MDIDFGWIAVIILVLSFIIGWIIAILREITCFVAFIMCIGKSNCKKDDCRLRRFCKRTAWSDREKELIRKKIDSLGDRKQSGK